MSQAVLPNSDESFPLTFVDGNGKTVAGPRGAVSSTVTQTNPWLSADGQTVNFSSPAAGIDFTITWHDPNGVVADVVTKFVTRALVASAGPVVAHFTP